MVTRALVVALIAAALLVATVAIDASMNRSWALDVRQEEGWVTVAQEGDLGLRERHPYYPFGAVRVDPNGTIEFRLRVDNGYPWSFDEPFEARAGTLVLAEGRLAADARSSGEAGFELSAKRFFDNVPFVEKPQSRFANVFFTLDVGGRETQISFGAQEAMP